MSQGEDSGDELVKEALIAIEELQEELEQAENALREPIAVIGIGCRFPDGADTPEKFWRNLSGGKDSVREVPAERWDVDEFYDADEAPGKTSTRFGSFLDHVDEFDPSFFGLSPGEAESMDPQQRLLLEVAWEALEHAGYDVDRLRGSQTGVFTGVMNKDYSWLSLADVEGYDVYTAMGQSHASASGRIAYLLDLRGPAVSVDTACSSSLISVQYAVENLRAGGCDMALATGVNLVLSPLSTVMTSKVLTMAPDGHCKAFDSRADGIVRGEGCGVVVLKRLSDARRDGDRVLAVVRGVATNQDGRSQGFTAPNGISQRQVIQRALENAGLEPSRVGYIEAHGTGTPLGDPIEIEAIEEVYDSGRDEKHTCAIGAVKTNIGHTESASGITGFIKTVLALQHRQIPPNLHFETVNPAITVQDDFWKRFFIPTELTDWQAAGGPRCAAVSSFGASGTNAHMILEEAPESEEPRVAPADEAGLVDGYVLLPLSARGPEAIRGLAGAYAEWLEEEGSDVPLSDAIYTAGLRRTRHDYRATFVGANRDELREKLEEFSAGGEGPGISQGLRSRGKAKVAFVCTGQGAQWWGMGRQLLETNRIFRDTVEKIDSLLSAHADWSLLKEMTVEESASRIAETRIAQPAIFALQTGLAAVWKDRGVVPAAIVGHSVGEVAAAHIAGVLDLETAVHVIYHRGRLMQEATGLGKMAAVELSGEKIQEYLKGFEDRLAVAAYNSPGSVTLSGEEDALNEVLKKLSAKNIFNKMLKVDYAFHSPQMAPFQTELAEILKDLVPAAPAIKLYASVTGQPAGPDDFNGEYWGRNIRQPVRFHPAISGMIDEGLTTFLELGPHPALSGYIDRCLGEKGKEGVSLPSLNRKREEGETMLDSLGALFAHGQELPEKLLAGRGVLADVPAYAWQRKSFWPKASRGVLGGTGPRTATDVPGRRLRLPGAIAFETQFTAAEPSYLKDHVLFDEVVVAGATYLSLVVGSARKALGNGTLRLQNVFYQEALALPEGAARYVQTHLAPDGEGHSFRVLSMGTEDEDSGEWVLHAEGRLELDQSEPEGPVFDPAVAQKGSESLTGREFYDQFHKIGYAHAGTFQWIDSAWRRDGEALAKLKAPAVLTDAAKTNFHPAFLDSLFQLTTLSLPEGGLGAFIDEEHLYVPWAMDSFELFRDPGEGEFWCHARCREGGKDDPEVFKGDLELYDTEGRLVARIVNWSLKRVSNEALLSAIRRTEDWLYEMVWNAGKTRRQSRADKGSWLILEGADPAGPAVTENLREAGRRCVVVRPGKSFKKEGDDEYSLNPASSSDFERVLKEAFATNAPRGIIHLWGLDATDPEQLNPDVLNSESRELSGSLLFIGQAVTNVGWTKLPGLWLATRGAFMINGNQAATFPTAASLWGMGRVIALENPEAFRGLIDLDPALKDGQEDAKRLLAEILYDGENEDHIAFRDGQRFTAELSRMKLDDPGTELRLDPAATYLITGGLGGLGLKTAIWLVERGAKQLVLTGRRKPTGEAKKSITAIKKLGAAVTVVTGDIARAEDVKSIFAEAEKIGPVRGIIHAAGVLDDGVLAQQDWKRFEKVMAPKVNGAWNLHSISADKDLDFFVLFSSVAALTGSPGQSNYAAGNAFMDSLVEYRRSRDLPALSVNWGPWAEVGMAAKLKGDSAAGEKGWTAVGVINPDQGLELMEKLILAGVSQAGVLPFKWPRFFEQFPAMASQSMFRSIRKHLPALDSDGEGGASSIIKKLEATEPGGRKAVVTEFVKEQLARVLGLNPSDPIDPQKGFFAMGGDSLSSVELRNRMQTLTGQALPTTLIFDYPSLEAISDYLADEVFQLSAVAPPAEPAVSAEAAVDDTARKQSIEQEVDSLSDAEAEAELLKELAGLD